MLKQIVRKNDWLTNKLPDNLPFKMEFGWGNGYVVIPESHPYHGKSYDDIPVEVHGGLTYGSIITKHQIDVFPGLTEEDIGSFLVGFDTCHYQDNPIDCNESYVKMETANLAEQLEVLSWLKED